MNKKMSKLTAHSLVIFILVTLIGSACTPASTPQRVESTAAEASDMQHTLIALRSQLNQTATAEKKVLLQQATAVVQTRTAAVTPGPTSTFTPTPNLLRTQQASGMFLKVQQYARDHYLSSTSGIYQRLNDQIHYYANPGHYKWEYIGLKLDDFAIESDLIWENTTETTGNSLSGCGFIFHSDGYSSYISAFLGLDGYVYMDSFANTKIQPLGKSYFGKVEVSQGNAHIALVISGNHYAFFVNKKMILQSISETDLQKTGALAYVVYSGSDKGVGTTCKFTNIDLWTVNPSS
jgi:hypothetical protein